MEAANQFSNRVNQYWRMLYPAALDGQYFTVPHDKKLHQCFMVVRLTLNCIIQKQV